MYSSLLESVLSLNESVKEIESNNINDLESLYRLLDLIIDRDIAAINLKKYAIEYVFENTKRATLFFDSIKKDCYADDKYNRSAYKAVRRIAKTIDSSLEYREILFEKAQELEARDLLCILDPIPNLKKESHE